VYWKPVSLAVIRACEELRSGGVGVWETMDAGPQVKMFTLENSLDAVIEKMTEIVPGAELRVCRPGGPGRLI
jgi:diphosphomevalonate decarboxylase